MSVPCRGSKEKKSYPGRVSESFRDFRASSANLAEREADRTQICCRVVAAVVYRERRRAKVHPELKILTEEGNSPHAQALRPRRSAPANIINILSGGGAQRIHHLELLFVMLNLLPLRADTAAIFPFLPFRSLLLIILIG